jgi:hypothetical protein
LLRVSCQDFCDPGATIFVGCERFLTILTGCSETVFVLTLMKYLCYTYPVNDRRIWQNWAEHLHRWGMINLAAAFLEAAGPLTLLGAQIIYLGQPMISPFVPEDHFEALTKILEEPGETRAFIDFLRLEARA